MPHSAHLTPTGFSGLPRLYVAGFWLLTCTFLLSMPANTDEQARIGLLILTIGGLACILLRMQARTVSVEITEEPAYVQRSTSETQLLRHIAGLLEPTGKTRKDVGVMLISIFSSVDEVPTELRTVDFVRAELYWAEDFTIYELAEDLLAVTAAGRSLDLDLERLSTTLLQEIQRRRSLSTASGTEELTMGVAVAHGGKASAEDILANARVALYAAQAHGSRVLFRHL